jgi:Carboxypeptidase regulatory-like domain
MRLLWVAILAAIIQQGPPSLPGSVEGMVTSSGAVPTPLAGVSIGLSNANFTDPFAPFEEFSLQTKTDGGGRFSFPDVPPGSYKVDVGLDGYGPGGSAFFTVSSGTRTKVPPISLTASATIRGHVLDRDGKGVAGASVEVLRLTSDEEGRRIWRPVGGPLETNSEGGYERTINGRGDYYVRTIVKSGSLRIAVYYPESTESGTAVPITLSEGAPITADIRIGSAASSETHRISGRLIRPPSEAGKSAFVELVLLQSNPAGPVEVSFHPLATSSLVLVKRSEDTPAAGDQRFEFGDVPSGRYNLLANANIDGEDYSSRAEIYVGDGDTETPDLVLRPAVEVRGKVTLEGELPGIRVLPGNFQGDGRNLRPQVGDIKLVLKPKDGLPLGVNGPGVLRMDRDGRSFSISDVPEGEYELSAMLESDGRPPGSNHYIADVRADGRSVFDTGFRVGVDPVESLEVLVGTNGGSIQGKIVGSQSPLPAALILVPESFRRSNGSLYRVIYLPRNAEFRMNGVAPGAYKLFAVPYLNETIPYRSLEFIARHESRAVSVTVQKGSTVEGVQAPYLALGR